MDVLTPSSHDDEMVDIPFSGGAPLHIPSFPASASPCLRNSHAVFPFTPGDDFSMRVEGARIQTRSPQWPTLLSGESHSWSGLDESRFQVLFPEGECNEIIDGVCQYAKAFQGFLQLNPSPKFCFPVKNGKPCHFHILGKGSYGLVLKGIDHMKRQSVALKYVKDALGTFFPRSKLIYREMHILHQLKHPHVVTLLHVCRPDLSLAKDICLVFEEMGLSLRSHLKNMDKQVTISKSNIKRWMYQLLTALSALHSMGILHRDLKPDNILLSKDCTTLKICDFGFARLNDECNEGDESAMGVEIPKVPMTKGLTRVVQTRWYRAPEIPLYRDGKYDEKVLMIFEHFVHKPIKPRQNSPPFHSPHFQQIDMWSYGCILGELLTYTPNATSNRGALFPGNDCVVDHMYDPPWQSPTSPTSPQLSVICEKLGMPDKFFLEKLKSNNPEAYQLLNSSVSIKDVCEVKDGINVKLERCFPFLERDCMQLLSRCLTFEPANRITAREALAHPWFSDISDAEKTEGGYVGEVVFEEPPNPENICKLFLKDIQEYNREMGGHF